MTKDFDKQAITHALQSRAGMTAEAAETIQKFNEQQTDWYTTCRKCKADLRGTLAQLKAHSCGTET